MSYVLSVPASKCPELETCQRTVPEVVLKLIVPSLSIFTCCPLESCKVRTPPVPAAEVEIKAMFEVQPIDKRS